MADSRRNHPRQTGEEDPILRTAIRIVIVLFVVAILFVGYRIFNPRLDVSQGRERLTAMDEVSVESVESRIEEASGEESDASEEQEEE